MARPTTGLHSRATSISKERQEATKITSKVEGRTIGSLGRAGTTTKRDLRQSAVLSAVCALLTVVTGRSGSTLTETRKGKKPMTIVESILQVEEPLLEG